MRRSLFPFVPFLLLVIPILEIAVFILLGGQIGVINTLLCIVLTALIGTVLLRQQGFALFTKAQSQMDQGKLPGKELAHGVMLLAAGLLLLTPGFVTDTFGFLLLVPKVRDGIFRFFKSQVQFATMGGSNEHFSAQSGSAGFSRSYEFHYDSQQRTSGQSKNKSDDPSIIDLDEEDFTPVDDKVTIGSDDAAKSPWRDEK